MELLLTPGPVMIPEAVMTAMSKSNIHHRTPEFEKIFGETLDLYQELISSSERPLILAASGTGGMEAALRNSCTNNDKIIILNAGKFAERWSDIGQILKLNVVSLNKDWGSTFELKELNEFFAQHTNAKALCCQFCETSTTALHNISIIQQALSTFAPDCLFIVDAITAVGAIEIKQAQSGIDILIAGSQKALMLPPGMAILSFSPRAVQAFQNQQQTSLYFNLANEYKQQLKNTTAFTPPISLIFGLNAALKLIYQEGTEQVYQRHLEVSQYLRTELNNLGFELIANTCPSPTVTGAIPAQGINADTLRKDLINKHAIRLAGGQDQYKGKIIRIGHMGMINLGHAERLITALKASI